MRPFLLRQTVAVFTLVLLLFLTALIVPLFFRLSGDMFDAKAVHRVSTPLIEAEFYVWVIASVFLFISEFRQGPAKNRRVYLGTATPGRVSRQSETTAATPSFMEGIGSILDLGDTLTEYNQAVSGEEADELAMRHDGLMVGRDLKQAVGAVALNGEAESERRRRPAGYVNG